MPFTVQQLIEGCPKPVTVSPNDPVKTALDLMIEHDFSQLPVIDGEDKPLGMITSDSILRALKHFGVSIENLCVANAMVKAVNHRDEDDLFEMLDDLRDTYGVLIVNGEGKLLGIVTSYDTTEYFRRRAEDSMLVEDIEGALKEHIRAAFADPATGEVDEATLAATIQDMTDTKRSWRGRFEAGLRKYLELQSNGGTGLNSAWVDSAFSALDDKNAPKTFDDLTLYDFVQLILHKSRADYYTRVFDLQADAIRNLLDGVRKTRNDLAHFRGEISSSQREQLHFCIEWLNRHPVPTMEVPPANIATHTETEPVEPLASVASRAVTIAPRDDIVPTEETPEPNESRYAPLASWLQGLRQDKIRMTFEQVEQLIGGKLPDSARDHRSWWANDAVGHVQSQQWLDAGWRVSTLNIPEEEVVFIRTGERERAYIDFFNALDRDFAKATRFPIKGHSPQGHNWHAILGLPDEGPQLAILTFSFAHHKQFRTELYIDTGDAKKNKQVFDALYAQKDEIETTLRESWSWERMNGKRASRIAMYHPGAITDAPEKLDELRRWAMDAMLHFHRAIVDKANRALKADTDA